MYLTYHDKITTLNNIFSGFKIKATCVGYNQHRHISLYDLKLDYGCRINTIMRYACEISIAMNMKTVFSIEPIPSKGIVRLHASHGDIKPLLFEEFIKNASRLTSDKYLIPILLGETNDGAPLWMDLAECPHLIVAGATGSGKSTTLHTIIANLLLRKDIVLSLIDTKRVEFDIYNNKKAIVVSSFDKASLLLDCIHNEMNNRYEIFSKVGISNIKEFPNMIKHVIIIDEIADLLLQDSNKEFELKLIKLAQKARAAGIYIIIATQRPSADVLTGLIKANFPARLACKVSSRVDSRVILDQHGAETLHGKGDAILKTSSHDMIRFQVAYVDMKRQYE